MIFTSSASDFPAHTAGQINKTLFSPSARQTGWAKITSDCASAQLSDRNRATFGK